MTRIKMTLVVLATLVAGVFSLPTASSADSLTWNVQSMYKHKVQIEFYAQGRRHAWPGGNQAYGLNDYDTHTYTLNCRSGERICYGAWVTGNSSKYWGVGSNNKYSCSNCCATCGAGDTPKIVLRP